jgi:hypothetical protein
MIPFSCGILFLRIRIQNLIFLGRSRLGFLYTRTKYYRYLALNFFFHSPLGTEVFYYGGAFSCADEVQCYCNPFVSLFFRFQEDFDCHLLVVEPVRPRLSVVLDRYYMFTSSSLFNYFFVFCMSVLVFLSKILVLFALLNHSCLQYQIVLVMKSNVALVRDIKHRSCRRHLSEICEHFRILFLDHS